MRHRASVANSVGGGLAEKRRQQRMSQFSGVSHARTDRSRRGQRHRIGNRTSWLFFSEPVNRPVHVSEPVVPPATSKRQRHSTPATNAAGLPGRYVP